jgi:hypothetical protein
MKILILFMAIGYSVVRKSLKKSGRYSSEPYARTYHNPSIRGIDHSSFRRMDIRDFESNCLKCVQYSHEIIDVALISLMEKEDDNMCS